MNSNNDHSYFRCTVTSSSERALKVKLVHNEQEYWVPKSLCEMKPKGDDGYQVIEIESWFSKKEGME